VIFLGSLLGQKFRFLSRGLEVLLTVKMRVQSLLKRADVAFDIFLNARSLKLAEERARDRQNNPLLVRLGARGPGAALDHFAEEFEVVGE